MRSTKKTIFYVAALSLILLSIWGISNNIINQTLEDRTVQRSQVYPFITSGNYDFDTSKIEISEGMVSLFDLRPDGATFYANYDSDLDGTWGNGDLTGVGIGGASISSGSLNLTGNTIKYVDYDGDLNIDSPQTGAIRFTYTPNYKAHQPIISTCFGWLNQ